MKKLNLLLAGLLITTYANAVLVTCPKTVICRYAPNPETQISPN